MNNFLSRKTSQFKTASICLVILFTLIFTESKAQLGRGCYVDGVLYTENTSKSNRHFYASPGNLTSVCGFQRTGNTNNCRIYVSGPIANNSSYTLYGTHFSNDWEEIVGCPLDEYVWVLIVVVAGFSFLKVRSVMGFQGVNPKN